MDAQEPQEKAEKVITVWPSDKDAFDRLCDDYHGVRVPQGSMFHVILAAYLAAQQDCKASTGT